MTLEGPDGGHRLNVTFREISAGVRVRPADVVRRGSPSPSREGGGKGPRPTDSPHPSVGPCRASNPPKSKSEVGGRRSRVSKPQPGGRGQGPATDRLPASVRRSDVEPENFQSPSRRSEVVGRGSRSPRHGVEGPRRTDSPHPCRGLKFSKSKPWIPRSRGLCPRPRLPRPESSAAVRGPGPRSVAGRRSRGSRSPGHGVEGPRRTDSPHPSVGPRRSGKFTKSNFRRNLPTDLVHGSPPSREVSRRRCSAWGQFARKPGAASSRKSP